MHYAEKHPSNQRSLVFPCFLRFSFSLFFLVVCIRLAQFSFLLRRQLYYSKKNATFALWKTILVSCSANWRHKRSHLWTIHAVKSQGGQAWTNPIVLSVWQWFSRKSGFKLWHIQNGVFDLVRLQTRNIVFVSWIFVPGNVSKIYRYPKHRKTLSWGKSLLTSHYRTLTNQNHHVGQVLFMVNLFSIFGWVVCCFFPGQPAS